MPDTRGILFEKTAPELSNLGDNVGGNLGLVPSLGQNVGRLTGLDQLPILDIARMMIRLPTPATQDIVTIQFRNR